MERTAYLMALIETGSDGRTAVKYFTTTSDPHPTCMLHNQSYAMIDSAFGRNYGEAKRMLLESVKARSVVSGQNSIWHQIYESLKENE